MLPRTIVASLAALALVSPALASGVAWHSDPREALTIAAQASKPVLVDAWATWCAPCQVMEETTWKDDRVVTAMGRFVPLKVDHDIQKLFVDRYAIEALPILLFLDHEGEEIARVLGMQSTEQVLSLMAKVADGYEPYRASLKDSSPQARLDAAAFLLDVGNAERAEEVLEDTLKAAKGADMEFVARIEMKLGEAQIAAGHARQAMKTYAAACEHTPAESAAHADALAGLVRAARERGDEKAAKAALEELRKNFPERAAALEAE